MKCIIFGPNESHKGRMQLRQDQWLKGRMQLHQDQWFEGEIQPC